MEGAAGYLEITLPKSVAAPGRITGVVLDETRTPVAGVELRLGPRQRAESAADGSFAFEYPKRAATLIATRPGYLPVLRPGIGVETPVPLLVEFGAKALEISGAVVDAEDSPLAGWSVNVVDPERHWSRAFVERLSSPDPASLPSGALGQSDAEGRFRIGGLLDRQYRLRAWDPKSGLSVLSEPVPAGSRDVVMRLPVEPFFDELRGVVVDRNGRGVGGAHVGVYLTASTVGGLELVQAAGASAAADGSFLLRRVPRRHVEFSVNGEGIEHARHPIEQCLVAGEARIEVVRSCHVQIEGEVGLVVTFRDAAGELLFAASYGKGGGFGGDGWRLRAPKSPVLSVSETAVTMAWSRDGVELGRRPIVLVPGAGVTPLVIGP